MNYPIAIICGFAFFSLGLPLLTIADERLLVDGDEWRALAVADSTKLHFVVGNGDEACNITATNLTSLVERAILNAGIKPIAGHPRYDLNEDFISEVKYPYLYVNVLCILDDKAYIYATYVGFFAQLIPAYNGRGDKLVGLVTVRFPQASPVHGIGITPTRRDVIHSLKEKLEEAVTTFKKVSMADDFIGSCSEENKSLDPFHRLICDGG